MAPRPSALGESRNEDAFRHLWPVFDETDPAFHRFMRWPALLDLVEAAAGGAYGAQVAGVIAELDSIAARSEPPILRVGLACVRPLLAADEQTEALFTRRWHRTWRATRSLGARTRFSFGRWLRRKRRTAASRAPLRESVALFDALGASLWSRRARGEAIAEIGRAAPDPLTRGLQLQAIPPDAQRMLARRMGASTVEVPSGHLAMVSHLAEALRLIEAAATAPARGQD